MGPPKVGTPGKPAAFRGDKLSLLRLEELCTEYSCLLGHFKHHHLKHNSKEISNKAHKKSLRNCQTIFEECYFLGRVLPSSPPTHNTALELPPYGPTWTRGAGARTVRLAVRQAAAVDEKKKERESRAQRNCGRKETENTRSRDYDSSGGRGDTENWTVSAADLEVSFFYFFFYERRDTWCGAVTHDSASPAVKSARALGPEAHGSPALPRQEKRGL